MSQYTDLLDKFFRGATSAEEELLLMEWLRGKSESDPELTDYYRAKWESADGVMDDEVKARIREKIDASIGRSEKPAAGRRISWGRVLPWFTAACVAVAAVVGWYSYAKVTAVPDGVFEIYTQKGQKTNIVLPDGTLVWLNSDSRLSYSNSYNVKRRDVNLVGEGYFEVAGNPERKFRVHTGNYTVEALGTEFNIKSYPADSISVTTLLEGSVRIEGDNGFSAILAPMESMSYNTVANRFTWSDSDRTYFAGQWRHNELIVESGTTLERLTQLLCREYNINFAFRSERIKNLCFEGVIKDNNLHNVLQLIGLSGEVVYAIEDNTVVLDEKL